MGDNFNDLKDKMINTLKKPFKLKRSKKILIIIGIICLIGLGPLYYWLTIDDGTYNEDDWSNTPYAASQYTNSFGVGDDGKLESSMTAQELWDKMIKNDSRVDLYLDSPEELLKLMNVEVVTQYLDTRPNPDAEIDWDTINDINSKEIQGIIKLKRADSNGNISTMIYTDPTTFQGYIDAYNSSGSESDKNNALKYFTLEKTTSSSGSEQTASPITAGDTIKIKSGLGSVHTYMGWQKITSTSSTQYKLREQAGMNFDSEGFGKINGRYVIACTTTYGTVGDYIDFYQEDGTIIPCIIGDIKNQDDSGCNKWGHDNGHCIIEFIVNKDTWYSPPHANPGTSSCHPEWNKNLTKAVNGGSYFDNPSFGTDAVTENGNTIEDDEDNNSNNESSSNNSDGWCWPTDGDRITSTFGPRSAPVPGASTDHGAIDIGVPVGTNVYACDDGKVTIAGWSDSAGNWVVIDHGNGYITKYMHNSELKVSQGDKVTKGQVIAKSGSTGHSSGPHVHFQVEYNGEKKDPLTFKYYNSDKGDGSNSVSTSGNGDEKSENTKYYAKVATWNEETHTIESNDSETASSSSTNYSMTTTNINYQELVSGYTMPFNYLWALLVIGEDKDFVLDLANLVYNSELEITVHDNLTVNTNTIVNTYTKKKKTDTEAQVTIRYGEESISENSDTVKDNWTDEETNDYKVTETTITKTNTLDVALTKANTWIVDYSQEYKYQQPQTNTTNNSQTLENKDYPNEPDSTSNADTYGHASSLLETQKSNYSTYACVYGNIDYIQAKIYNATVNRNVNTTNVTETAKYVSSPANIEPKDNIDAEEPNFVNLLDKDENRKAKLNILNVPNWLFEILENNDDTKDMVDLTNYLLYKLVGHGFGEDLKPEDIFSAYDPSNFVTVSDDSDIVGNSIEEKVWFALIDKGFSEYATAGVMGNIYGESGFNPSFIEAGYNENNGGIGLCQWTNNNRGSTGRNANLKKYAQKKGSTWKDESVQIEFLLTELTGNGSAKGYANKAFMSNSIYGRRYTESDWKNAENIEDATKAFCATFERPGKQYFYSSMDKRVNAAKDYYNRFHGKDRPISSNESGGNQNIVSTAKSKIGCPYVWGAAGPNSFDCSGFVYWVYKTNGIIVPRGTDGYMGYRGSKKEISWSQAKPGDILIICKDEGDRWRYGCGHAGIYLGGDKYIHAPSSGKTVTIVNSGAKTKFKHVFRFK